MEKTARSLSNKENVSPVPIKRAPSKSHYTTVRPRPAETLLCGGESCDRIIVDEVDKSAVSLPRPRPTATFKEGLGSEAFMPVTLAALRQTLMDRVCKPSY